MVAERSSGIVAAAVLGLGGGLSKQVFWVWAGEATLLAISAFPQCERAQKLRVCAISASRMREERRERGKGWGETPAEPEKGWGEAPAEQGKGWGEAPAEQGINLCTSLGAFARQGIVIT